MIILVLDLLLIGSLAAICTGVVLLIERPSVSLAQSHREMLFFWNERANLLRNQWYALEAQLNVNAKAGQ